MAAQIGSDERAHVVLLRGALGSAAVAMPDIDLGALGLGFGSLADFLKAARILEDSLRKMVSRPRCRPADPLGPPLSSRCSRSGRAADTSHNFLLIPSSKSAVCVVSGFPTHI